MDERCELKIDHPFSNPVRFSFCFLLVFLFLIDIGGSASASILAFVNGHFARPKDFLRFTRGDETQFNRFAGLRLLSFNGKNRSS